jgi:hypothetical protein
MSRLFRKCFDLEQCGEQIAAAPYGMIEVWQGSLQFVQLRPWPKLISGVEALWIGGWTHRHLPRDRVQFWYSQPVAHRNFLVLSYAMSALGATTVSIRAALQTLDRIAELKRSDAILCQASNPRLTDRVMRFWGFERHLPHKRGRHYIRRFYGEYPSQCRWRAAGLRPRQQMERA